MKTYGRVEVELQAFLASTFVGSDRHLQDPAPLARGNTWHPPGRPAGLNVVAKRKNPCLCSKQLVYLRKHDTTLPTVDIRN